MKDKLKKVVQLFFPIILGSLVGLIIKNKIDYDYLIKPLFSPPKFIFPIAWSIIYLLMGISYLLLNRKNDIKGLEKGAYYAQFVVNILWSIIFFLFKYRLLACWWIILLDFLVLWMLVLFYKNDKFCCFLNIPYFIWCLYATYLTIGIYMLN
ncbi:MAG: tryptophan-rich sensory protein [Bacilli bacterium]|nr:tryptophan-rich sensory protein [Bacilli bacterium]